MRVLVTGGSGFIGRNICIGLDREGIDYTILDKRCNLGPRHLESLSPNDPEAKCDAVVHCAAHADVSSNWESDDERESLYRNNILATIALLEACPVPVVFLSTGAVYRKANICNETCGTFATSPYAASKLAGEALVQAYCHARGVSAHIYRLASVVGHSYHHGHIADMVEQVRKTGKFHARSISRPRSFVHVEYVVRAVIGALCGTVPQGTYNVAGDTWSWRQTADVMQSVRAFETTCEEKAEGWIGDTHSWLDPRRLQKFVPPSPVSIGDGVRDALRSLGWYGKEEKT
jgi:UDP-glucose 4-epimerase